MRRRLLGGVAAASMIAATAGLPARAATDRSEPGWEAAKGAALRTFQPPSPATVTSSSADTGGTGYTSELLHLLVHVGPGRSTACPIVGEIFVPRTASAANPVPAILTTNGFGGSYKDQIAAAELFADQGYAVLAYSGLGFGGSGCQIELDLPDWDGAAASQLISWLGDQPFIIRDGSDDPRVGMFGGSYGGDVQFSTAAVDPRVDTLVPVITWNDLAYSLAPNNDSARVEWSDAEPGVGKLDWPSLFFADGLAQPAEGNVALQPSSCPDFDPRVCQSYLSTAALGYPDQATIDLLRQTSMVSYHERLHLPVMLMQGEGDTLFDIDEAVANYQELKSSGDPVKLVLQSWGHSVSTPAPGELTYTAPYGYETTLILDWFAKWLRGASSVSTGPAVEYFRDWVAYKGSAQPAYGTASSWPVGGTLPLYLSGASALVTSRTQVAPGRASFVNPAGGEPASYSETSDLQSSGPFSSIPPSDPPGTSAHFETAPLAAALDSVGIPVLRFDLSSTSPPGLDPATDPVVFAKVYDVSPAGQVTLVERLVSPIRVSGTSGPITMTLPGVVHRYLASHRIELVLAATDQAFIGPRVPDVLTVTTDPAHPGVLELPVGG